MTERFYQLAGSIIRVIGPRNRMDCNDNALSQYQTTATQWDHTLCFTIVDSLSAPEGELVFSEPSKRIYRHGDTQIRYEGAVSSSVDDAYIRIERTADHSFVQVRERSIAGYITARVVLNAMEAEHRVVQARGMLLHASCIRWKDKAILFTAPSGTGKSTQADLWCHWRGAELINGDRAAVIMGPNGPEVRGTPFAGTSGVCKNVTLPLSCVVYLSQAPTTVIQTLTGVNAFRRIWEGCSLNVWNSEDLEICAQTVSDVIAAVPVFHLLCTPDETAVNALEQALSGYQERQ